MEQCFDEDPPVKTEPVELDYCQDDVIESLMEPGPATFVNESQPILVPEIVNGDVDHHADEDEDQLVVLPKRRRGPVKKKPAKETTNKKKLTNSRRKSDREKKKLVESTVDSVSSSYLPPSMLEEPRDVIIKPDQDSPAHLSIDLPCPPTLQEYTEDEISSAFEQCGAGSRKLTLKLKFADQDSLFGQVYTILTNNKKSCLYERQYLHRFWLQKYKPESLEKFNEEQIGTAFLLCYHKQLKLNYNLSNSLFHKVYTFLTESKESNCIERRYLFDLWTIKFKDALHQPEPDHLKKYSKNLRRKMLRRAKTQQNRDILLQQATNPPPEGHSSPELETDFQTEQGYEDDEVPSFSPQIPAEQREKQIRIRVKVEIGANVDDDDDYYDASIVEGSSGTNDISYEAASPVPLSPHISVPDNDKSSPQQKDPEDTDPKLILKPAIRLTRLSARKLELEREEKGSTEIKCQSEKTSIHRKSRKAVTSVKYDDDSADDDSSVNHDENHDYIASELDHNNSNDNSNSDSDLNTQTAAPAQRKRTTISSRSASASAKALKRARGRPRIHPIKVKKPRLQNTVFHKLINVRLWGNWKHHKAPNQVPIPVELWQESHGKHGEFVVSNTCENLEDIEKTAPSAGKGTFANPHWTYSDTGNEDERLGPLKCVCPACGLTFLEIDELLQHRDKNHREYLPMCVICSRPMAGKDNIAPHLGSHFNKNQLEEFLEEELTTLGPPPECSAYRLYNCQKCSIIFVGTKRFKEHTNGVHSKVRKMENIRKTIALEPGSFIKKYTTKEISECKVCGMPLSQEFMSFHLRTHFNFEEEKKHFREQQSKIRKTKNLIVEKNIPGKDRTDVCIMQLKNLLEALQRRNGKAITKWPKPIKFNDAAKKEKRNVNVKRDGNYGPVQCATCGKVIATVYSLRVHEMSMHEGGLENKFECSICHRPFGTSSRVHSHTPRHFNLEEQEKYSVWKGSLKEFLERLNSGEDLSKPPTPVAARGRKRKLEIRSRRVRKKPGRPRKHHHLYEEKNVHKSGGSDGNQVQSQPSISRGATAEVVSTTSTFSSAAEVPGSMLNWSATYGRGQQGHDDMGYFERQNN